MDRSSPVYTLENECHDCYKCVRQCSVKAILVKNGHASVIPNKCIACGHCVEICPSKAKRVRDDVNKARALLASGKDVYVSLAPSWAGLLDCTKQEIISALKQLGFKGVSETALGAQEVSIETTKLIAGSDQNLFISTACPAIVDYIRYYLPEYTSYLTPIASPALTHAKLLRKHFGEDIGVVFIGPCIAKKNEADRHPDLINVSLTFKELAAWLDEARIVLKSPADEGEAFVPYEADEGALYPIEGGMNKTIEICGAPKDVQLINISPVQRFKTSLKNLDPASLTRKVFIEALACEGGCTAGPGGNTAKAGLEVVSDILNYSHLRDRVPSEPDVVVREKFEPSPIEKPKYAISSIAEALALIGKYSQEDELNCGGCGYNTCHGLAKALLAGEAEPSMCQAYMRKLATRKASAMLRCMPSAVVIVDADLNIVETNEAFVKMFAPELMDLFKMGTDGIAGAQLEKILPCTGLFKNTLKTGLETHKEHYPIGEKLYDISLFEIDSGKLVGAIITDVTKTQLRREQIAKKAQEVIEKNIATVQNIACLLGEHMVDTELLLSQIAEGYKQEDDE